MFNASDYFTKIESPEIDTSKDKRSQVVDYINIYFDMSKCDHLQKIRMSCKTYANGVLAEDVLQAHSSEALAVVGITYALKAFTESEAWEQTGDEKPFIANEAFTLFCNCISKAVEMGEWSKEEATEKITAFHEKCISE